MAFEKHYGLPQLTETSPCAMLRSKAIYVTGSLVNPDHPDEEGAKYCWCNMTQHILGPDQKDVNQSDCAPGRHCYRELA
jgi:hypothetical protein